MRFLRGIRTRLTLVALSLLALPWLAAKFIAGMETSLRAQQEQAIQATSRAIAVALNDRPGLFGTPGMESDPEEEERRRIVALFAAACSVSSGDPDDDEVTTGIGGTGGDGGSGGTSPSTTTGTQTTTTGVQTTTTGMQTTTTGGGGSGGSGGSGGDDVECLDDEEGEIHGEPATCEPQVDNCCARCMAANCCEEYSECFAFDPFNICGGANDEESEIIAFINCMLEIGVDEGGSTPGTEEGSDFENCMAEATNNVSDPICNSGTISGPTNALGVCLHGDEDGLGGCFNECLNSDFDEDSCTYEE